MGSVQKILVALWEASKKFWWPHGKCPKNSGGPMGNVQTILVDLWEVSKKILVALWEVSKNLKSIREEL
jgi:hypothetical protein